MLPTRSRALAGSERAFTPYTPLAGSGRAFTPFSSLVDVAISPSVRLRVRFCRGRFCRGSSYAPPPPCVGRVDHILYVVNKGPASILWFSLPAHILLPQRTTLFAYPMALLALLLVTRAYMSMANGGGWVRPLVWLWAVRCPCVCVVSRRGREPSGLSRSGAPVCACVPVVCVYMCGNTRKCLRACVFLRGSWVVKCHSSNTGACFGDVRAVVACRSTGKRRDSKDDEDEGDPTMKIAPIPFSLDDNDSAGKRRTVQRTAVVAAGMSVGSDVSLDAEWLALSRPDEYRLFVAGGGVIGLVPLLQVSYQFDGALRGLYPKPLSFRVSLRPSVRRRAVLSIELIGCVPVMSLSTRRRARLVHCRLVCILCQPHSYAAVAIATVTIALLHLASALGQRASLLVAVQPSPPRGEGARSPSVTDASVAPASRSAVQRNFATVLKVCDFSAQA